MLLLYRKRSFSALDEIAEIRGQKLEERNKNSYWERGFQVKKTARRGIAGRIR